MGVNFRKRVSLGPGIKLNFSKNGMSTTIGTKGASVNVGKNGIYTNANIPGTGLYARQKVSSGQRASNQPAYQGMNLYDWIMMLILIFSMFMFIICVLFPHYDNLPIFLIAGIIAQIVYWVMWLLLKD